MELISKNTDFNKVEIYLDIVQRSHRTNTGEDLPINAFSSSQENNKQKEDGPRFIPDKQIHLVQVFQDDNYKIR